MKPNRRLFSTAAAFGVLVTGLCAGASGPAEATAGRFAWASAGESVTLTRTYADGRTEVVESGSASARAPSPQAVAVTVHSIGRDGKAPTGGIGQLIDTESGQMVDLPFDAAGDATVEVEPGVYDLTVFGQSPDPDGGRDSVTLMAQPKVAVQDQPVELTADARLGVPISTTVDAGDAGPVAQVLSMRNGPRDRGVTISALLADHKIYAVPSESADADHDYMYAVRQVLAPPADAAEQYQYNLVFDHQTGIPETLSYAVEDSELAALDTTYSFPSDAAAVRTDRAVVQTGAVAGTAADLTLAVPARRVEFYTARPDVEWEQTLETGGQTYEKNETYEPGPAEREWKPES